MAGLEWRPPIRSRGSGLLLSRPGYYDPQSGIGLLPGVSGERLELFFVFCKTGRRLDLDDQPSTVLGRVYVGHQPLRSNRSRLFFAAYVSANLVALLL